MRLKTIVATYILLGTSMIARAQEAPLTKESFTNLDLNRQGLEQVKQLVAKADYEKAATVLLQYYRTRTVKHPVYNVQDKQQYAGKPIGKDDQEKADNALLHLFKPQKGYGFFDYGKDINWQYWPVKDNEVRWQLHRVYWWQSMGLAYWSSGDEKYAKEWVFQFRDWAKKNVLGTSAENDSFAWRPLEISERIQSLTGTFNMFVSSPNFTPHFLLEFLNNYHQQADYILHHYSKVGNHLLFEGQRMVYAGCFFPEMNDAATWRQSGITVLNTEIKKQVLDDGVQFELSPAYHKASIDIFLKALRMAQLAGVEKDFPQSYKNTVENMVMATINFSFPDYQSPMFGDSWMVEKRAALRQYQDWAAAFPDNKAIQYFATDGKAGTPPAFLSRPLKNSGFYTFRNGWNNKSTVLVLKAGPPGEFHAQPDNGTFELWVKGRNFMPDAGCFVYSGDSAIMRMRNWYRQTMVHNTLTLDNKNMETCNASLIKWQGEGKVQQLTYTNPSYANLSHKRTVFFIDNAYFLIIDQADGAATGTIGAHFQLAEESKPIFDNAKKSVATQYSDGNNLLIQYLNKDNIAIAQEEGKVSYQYRKEIARPAFAFEKKGNGSAQTFVTVLYPFEGGKAPQISMTENKGNNFDKGIIDITLTVNGNTTSITATTNK
ncbi:MAG: heparinase II/III family protein [Filimonas sp.]|nr:heparinase II/III family protein [Filimonas sp.]